MNFKKFVQFIEEGGKAVENVSPIKAEYQKATFKDFEDKVLKGVLKLNKKEYKPLGSTFKKLPGASSGDMDIAVGVNALAENFKVSTDKVLNELYKVLNSHFPNLSVALLSGFNIVSIAWPISSNDKTETLLGSVQIDLMLTNDTDFSSFLFHSPDFTVKNPSQYKGLYRTEFLKSIFHSLPISKITKYFEDEFDGKYKGDIKELGRLLLNTNGLHYQIKSFVGKRGKVKNGKVLNNEFITKNPAEIVKAALGPKATIKDTDSFESIWKAFNRTSFPFKSMKERKKIVKYFVGVLNTKKLPIPEQIKNSKYYDGEQ